MTSQRVLHLTTGIFDKSKKKKKKKNCFTSDQVILSHLLASTPSLYPALFQDNDTFWLAQ